MTEINTNVKIDKKSMMFCPTRYDCEILIVLILGLNVSHVPPPRQKNQIAY